MGIVMCTSLAACGGASDPIDTAAAAGPSSTAVTSPVPTDAAPTTEAPSTDATTTTTVDGPSTPQPSPVDGLDSAQLREVVDAPAPANRRSAGPVADQVAVADRTLWRVTVPGDFDLLGSRITVSIGGTDVGEGIVAPDLSRLVAIVADPAALVAGAPVTYRWGSGEPVSAGALEVAR